MSAKGAAGKAAGNAGGKTAGPAAGNTTGPVGGKTTGPVDGGTRHAAPPSLTLSIQYATETTGLPRWRLRRWVRRAVEYTAAEEAALLPTPRFVHAALTLRLVDADEGLALNHQYRGRDYATNVLTFEYGVDDDGCASGDIVLCVPVLHREAAEQGKPLLAHAAHLTVHGVLHALGYDHINEDDAEDMEALETRILASLRIPDPYAAPAVLPGQPAQI